MGEDWAKHDSPELTPASPKLTPAGLSLIFGHIPLAGYVMDQSLAFEITRRSPTRVISKANGGRLGMTRQYIALIHCEISNLVLFCLPSTRKAPPTLVSAGTACQAGALEGDDALGGSAGADLEVTIVKAQGLPRMDKEKMKASVLEMNRLKRRVEMVRQGVWTYKEFLED